ncbi:ribonuclease E/G [Hirschia litorea]|uniref:Ribonuclease E/G n=1 Tax=Hirschia litorea TaxID=1199156 RepID=A0ABW2IH95_9PROT
MSIPPILATEYVSDRIGVCCRVLVDSKGRAFRLQYDPWSLRGKRPLLGEIWRGRVITKDPGLGGCIVDIGLNNHVFLQTKKAIPSDGSKVDIRIKSEAWHEKSAVAVLENSTFNENQAQHIGLLQKADDSSFYDGVTVIETVNDINAWDVTEAALERAVERHLPLQGGGSISVEPTRALIAVDIDAGGRENKGDRSRFALDTNKLAAEEIAYQLSLSSLGGIVAIDFLKMKSTQQNECITKELEKNLATLLRRKTQFAKMSPFGVLELSIAHRCSPVSYLHSMQTTAEYAALIAIKALEREAFNDRGAKFKVSVSPEAYRWLEGKCIEWKIPLANRIGHRFEFEEETSIQTAEYKIGKN